MLLWRNWTMQRRRYAVVHTKMVDGRLVLSVAILMSWDRLTSYGICSEPLQVWDYLPSHEWSFWPDFYAVSCRRATMVKCIWKWTCAVRHVWKKFGEFSSSSMVRILLFFVLIPGLRITSIAYWFRPSDSLYCRDWRVVREVSIEVPMSTI